MVRIWDDSLNAGLRTDKIHYHQDHGRFPPASFVLFHILFMDLHTLAKQKKRSVRLLDTYTKDPYLWAKFLQAWNAIN